MCSCAGPGRAVRAVPRAEREQEHLQGGAHAVRVLRAGAAVLRAERAGRPAGALPRGQPLQPGHGAGAAHARALGLHPVRTTRHLFPTRILLKSVPKALLTTKYYVTDTAERCEKLESQ